MRQNAQVIILAFDGAYPKLTDRFSYDARELF
jgi:hypothetical protein